MHKVRKGARDESPKTDRRKQTVNWCRENLHQIRHSRISREGSAGVGWEEVRRQDCGYDLFLRGEWSYHAATLEEGSMLTTPGQENFEVNAW